MVSHIVTFSFVDKMASHAKTLFFFNFSIFLIIVGLLYMSYRKQLSLIVYGIILTEVQICVFSVAFLLKREQIVLIEDPRLDLWVKIGRAYQTLGYLALIMNSFLMREII